MGARFWLADGGRDWRSCYGRRYRQDITGELVESFVTDCDVSPKTMKNLIATLPTMWNSAKAWGYVGHDPFDALVLPESRKEEQRYFTIEEMCRILEAAPFHPGRVPLPLWPSTRPTAIATEGATWAARTSSQRPDLCCAVFITGAGEALSSPRLSWANSLRKHFGWIRSSIAAVEPCTGWVDDRQ